MGPSWYWMPDVLKSTFNGSVIRAGFYELERLDPPPTAFIFPNQIFWMYPPESNTWCTCSTGESPAVAKKLRKFLDEAKYKYEVGVNKLVYQPGLSITELF